jgi:release factor glutamine methyltransferase
MTLQELLSRAETALRSAPHPERARLDAETLLLRSLQSSQPAADRAWLMVHADEHIDRVTQSIFDTMLTRRTLGEPIQYIAGETEFFGLPFAVTPDVLIPRPETEHLVEEVIRLAGSFPQDQRLEIADIGTGSGAIAIAVAHALPQAHIVATDISANALAIAEQNAERNGVAERIEFLEGDLLSPVVGRRFSIVASNPPYVPLDDRASLSVEVREHEPHTALFAGDDGLDVYRRLIPTAREHLVPGGWLVLEFGYGQQPAIEGTLVANGFSNLAFWNDYQGIPRTAAGLHS